MHNYIFQIQHCFNKTIVFLFLFFFSSAHTIEHSLANKQCSNVIFVHFQFSADFHLQKNNPEGEGKRRNNHVMDHSSSLM